MISGWGKRHRRGAPITERGELITWWVIYAALFLWTLMLIVRHWPTWWLR